MIHMLKALIYQLLKNPKRSIPQSLYELRARPGNETQSELELILEEAAEKSKHLYLVFDAIDEADTLQTLRPLLEFFNDYAYGNCKILVTGRTHRHEIDAASWSFDTASQHNDRIHSFGNLGRNTRICIWLARHHVNRNQTSASGHETHSHC